VEGRELEVGWVELVLVMWLGQLVSAMGCMMSGVEAQG